MKFAAASLALAALAYAAPTTINTAEDALAALQERNSVLEWDLEKRQNTPAINCTTKGVHFIIIRGHGGYVTINKTQVPDPNVFNVLAGLRTQILAQIPGSTVLGLRYDYNNQDEVSGTVSGTKMFTQYVIDYAASCPNSKIATLGYSQGALVVMDTLCGASEFPIFPSLPINSKYAKNIIAAFTYGDESRMPMQPWNYGTCPTSTGMGQLPRFNSFACRPFQASMRGYCDREDNFCCLGGNNTGPAHAAYVKVYNQDVIDFTKARLAAALGQK